MESEIKIFSGSQSYYLASKIAEKAGERLGKLELIRFSDGEFQPIIQESIRGSFFFIIQSTFPPSDNLMELLLIVDAAKRASARYITAVIPYFGYARQDRKDRPRVAIGAKLIADLLETAGVTRLITMDLHAGQIQGFFNIPVDHLSSSVIFYNYIEQLQLDNLTFASPDIGSTHRARTFAQHFNANLVICDKHRKRPNEIEAMTMIGEVEGQNVIIVDDLVDTAGTLCNAAQLLMNNGARSVRALITHPVLSGNAYERIEESVLAELVVCNTIPLKLGKPISKIKVLSVEDIFATAIRNAYEFKSINSLFV